MCNGFIKSIVRDTKKVVSKTVILFLRTRCEGILLAFSGSEIAAGCLVNNGPKTYRSVFRSKKSNLFSCFCCISLFLHLIWLSVQYGLLFYSFFKCVLTSLKGLLDPSELLAARKLAKIVKNGALRRENYCIVAVNIISSKNVF